MKGGSEDNRLWGAPEATLLVVHDIYLVACRVRGTWGLVLETLGRVRKIQEEEETEVYVHVAYES